VLPCYIAVNSTIFWQLGRYIERERERRGERILALGKSMLINIRKILA
jgi:hypothetical protein